MFNNLTYKQKFMVVVGLFILLFLACYKKTFKHTIVAKEELALVEKKLSNVDNTNSNLFRLKNDIKILDNLIGGNTTNPEKVQQELLSFISDLGINITAIEDVHIYEDDKFIIYSNQIQLEGNYKELINTLYAIEKQFKNSRIASANFFSKKNYRTNKSNLYLKLILQNYAGKK